MTATPPLPRHHWRKRYVVPLIVLGLLLIVFTVAYVRGTWGTAEIRDPRSEREGIICYLHKPGDGTWQIRCAMFLPHPAEKVWEVVTDYEHFAEIFPTLKSCTSEKQEGGDVRLTGEAHSLIGDYPFDIVVKHETAPTLSYLSHWEGGSGSAQQLKGSWTVSAMKHGSLLVYTSHAKIKGYPDWVVVNALLLRQPKVIQAVADRLAKEGR